MLQSKPKSTFNAGKSQQITSWKNAYGGKYATTNIGSHHLKCSALHKFPCTKREIDTCLHIYRSKQVTIDTGTARTSSRNEKCYLLYFNAMNTKHFINTFQQGLLKYWLGEEISKRFSDVLFPIKNPWLDFGIPVIRIYVPILISSDDMHYIEVYLNNLANRAINPSSEHTVQMGLIDGHPILI